MGQAIGLAVWSVSSGLPLFETSAEHLLYTSPFCTNYFSQLVHEG